MDKVLLIIAVLMWMIYVEFRLWKLQTLVDGLIIVVMSEREEENHVDGNM